MSNVFKAVLKRVPKEIGFALVGFLGVFIATIANHAISASQIIPTSPLSLSGAATNNSSPTTCELAEVFPQTQGCNAYATFRDHGGEIDDLVFDDISVYLGQFSLKLTYTNAQELAFSGWYADWTSSEQGYFDASGYSRLTFWLRGESGGESFQVGLRDTAGNEQKAISVVATAAQTWEQVTVPLSAYQENVDLTRVQKVVFAFTRANGSGTVYIDDIAFAP